MRYFYSFELMGRKNKRINHVNYINSVLFKRMEEGTWDFLFIVKYTKFSSLM